jgi:hypothetical protein
MFLASFLLPVLLTTCVFSHKILCLFLILASIFSFSFTARPHCVIFAFLSSLVVNHSLCDLGPPQGSRFDSSLWWSLPQIPNPILVCFLVLLMVRMLKKSASLGCWFSQINSKLFAIMLRGLRLNSLASYGSSLIWLFLTC